MDSTPSAPTPSAGGAASVNTNSAPKSTPNVTPAATGGAGAQAKTPVPAKPDSKHADTPQPGSETQAQKAVRKHKIKVDGVEEEVDLDALDDASIVKALQMGKAAQKRMQEAAEVKKREAEFKEALKRDPRKALKEHPDFGIDIRKQIEEDLIREYQESQMSEEARRAKQLERELAARDAEIKRIDDEKKAVAQQELEDKLFAETEANFVAAMEQSDLPRNRETLFMMGQIAMINHKNKLELTPQQMAAETKSRLTQLHQYVTRNMKGDALVKHLGDDVVKEVLRHAVRQAKARQVNNLQAPPPAQQTDVTDLSDRAARKPVDARDARKFFKGLK